MATNIIMLVIGLLLSSSTIIYVDDDNLAAAISYINCLNEIVCLSKRVTVLAFCKMTKSIRSVCEKLGITFTTTIEGNFDLKPWTFKAETVLEIVAPILNSSQEVLRKILRLSPNSVWKLTEFASNKAKYEIYTEPIKAVLNSEHIDFLPDIAIYPSEIKENTYVFISYSAVERLKQSPLLYLVNPKSKKLLHKLLYKHNVITMYSTLPKDELTFAFALAVYVADSVVTLKQCVEGEKLADEVKELKKSHMFALRKRTVNLEYSTELKVQNDPLTNTVYIKGPRLLRSFSKEMDLTKDGNGAIKDLFTNKARELTRITQWSKYVLFNNKGF